MKLEITKKEYEALADTIARLQSNDVNMVFSTIFGKDHIPEIKLHVKGDIMSIDMEERTALTFFRVMGNHTTNIGKLIRMRLNPVALPGWIQELKTFGRDISRVFRGK